MIQGIYSLVDRASIRFDRPGDQPDQVRPTLSARQAIHSLAENSSVSALAVHGRYLYVGGENGVARFALADGKEGSFVRLTKGEGLSGNKVRAMAASPEAAKGPG